MSLEYLKWLVCYATSETVPAMETNVDVCLRTAALALENPQLSEAVSALDNGLMASSCVLSLHSLLKGPYSYDVAKVWYILDPLSTGPPLLQIYTMKFTQPPLLCLLLGLTPSPFQMRA